MTDHTQSGGTHHMTKLRRGLARTVRAVDRRLPARVRRPGAPLRPSANGGATATAAGPQVERETTYLGPVMDEAVYRARQRMRPGQDPDYDLIHENFDAWHYLLQAPHLLEDPDVDLIEHFLEEGTAAGLTPHPDFSPTAYVARYPRKTAAHRIRHPYLAWLKRGRAAGHIADPAPRIHSMAQVLGREPAEVAQLVADRRRSLQQRFRTGKLGEMMAKATEIEPLIGAAWPEVASPKILPVSSAPVVGAVHAIHEAHAAAGWRTARLVLVINRARWGGGRRMEGHLAHALADEIGAEEIVVIYTDDGGTAPPGRFPEGVREINFAQLTESVPREQAQHALVMLLRTFGADSIVNINSRMLYEATRRYARALAASERLYLVFFCNEQTAMGTWMGWSLRYFYRLFDLVAGVITDSSHLAEELVTTYKVPEKDRDRMHVFRAPVDRGLPDVSDAPRAPQRRPQVFWAGRWDRQKRIDIFFAIARAMPEVDFRMWGEPVTERSTVEVPSNVSLEGRYAHIADVPLAEADCWLYTSAWDGVPSQLLEVAMTGIPIVGSQVGGTREILRPDHAWPVTELDDVDAYVAAIRAVLDDPAEARNRARRLRADLAEERTASDFAQRAADLMLSESRTRTDT